MANPSKNFDWDEEEADRGERRVFNDCSMFIDIPFFQSRSDGWDRSVTRDSHIIFPSSISLLRIFVYFKRRKEFTSRSRESIVWGVSSALRRTPLVWAFLCPLTLFTYNLKTETEHKTNELYNKTLIKLDFGCTKMIKPNEGKSGFIRENFRPSDRAHQIRSKLVELRKTCKS